MKVSEIPASASAPPEPDPLPLRHLFGSAEERRAFLTYHLADPVVGSLEWLGFHALARLSPGRASDAGASIATAPRLLSRKQPWYARMQRNVARLRPDIQTDAEIEGFMASWFRHIGRTHAEYPVLHKIRAERHFQLSWDEAAGKLLASGQPAVFVNCHLGSYDVTVLSVDVEFGSGASTFGPFQPVGNRFRNRLAARVRRKLNFNTVAPGPIYRRYLPRLMGDGKQSIVLHIDSYLDGTVVFPLFGREPVGPGNLQRALKAARIFDVPVVPLLAHRTASGQTSVRIHAPLWPQDIGGSRHDMRAGIEYLNGIYEPAVRQHLDQWFMLPWLELDE